MKYQHTPGPWEPKSYVGNWAVIHSKDGAHKNIALLPAGKADAHLIAAAPEMLEVLGYVRDAMEASGGWEGDEDVFRFVVQAIAKATGPQE